MIEDLLEQQRKGFDLSFRPRVFDLSRSADVVELRALIPSLVVFDTIHDQLADLLAAREPASELSFGEKQARIARHLEGRATHEYGRWVHYPWSGRLVHLLPPAEFDELRADRNRYKQLPAERAILRSKTIAIAGLSVGQAGALTLALEGIGGHYRLADFDILALSNLNRLRAGVHELSVNKAVLLARALYELDPYLDVCIFPDGVTDANLDEFLAGVDLLVEECDDLYMKVRLRERARELRVPVVMDTSDSGLLDVERFDREPERAILHGLLSGTSAAHLRGLSAREKLPFIVSAIGIDRMTRATAASLCEVKRTISTWPQLGSSVMLGGALVADCARRIFLDELRQSGRFYVDLDQLVRDEAAAPVPAPEPLALETAGEARRSGAPMEPPMTTGDAISADEIRFAVAHGIMAPSAGNAQPWHFAWDGENLLCRMDGERGRAFLDVDGLASCVALGAAVENIALSATKMGRAIHIEPFPVPSEPLLACRIAFGTHSNAEPSPLFDFIHRRVTNRRLPRPPEVRPLDPADVEALRGALGSSGAYLGLVSDRREMSRIGMWLGRADRLRFLSPVMHAEMMRELRWTPEEVVRTRNGLDVATLVDTASDRAVLRILSSPSTVAFLKQIGGGASIEQATRQVVAASSALALLSVPRMDRSHEEGTYFDGGRQLQRMWLCAASRNVAVQPLGTLPCLLLRFERGGHDLDAEARCFLEPIQSPFREAFGIPESHAVIMLLRLSYAEPPIARSLRRPLDEILTIR